MFMLCQHASINIKLNAINVFLTRRGLEMVKTSITVKGTTSIKVHHQICELRVISISTS